MADALHLQIHTVHIICTQSEREYCTRHTAHFPGIITTAHIFLFFFFQKKESFVLQKSAAEIQGINNDAIVPILCMNFVGLLKFAQTKFPKT